MADDTAVLDDKVSFSRVILEDDTIRNSVRCTAVVGIAICLDRELHLVRAAVEWECLLVSKIVRVVV